MTQGDIRLFTKSWCGWCREARAWLDTRGFAYSNIDIEADPDAANEMFRLSGQHCVPTIAVGEHVLGDFDSHQLETFLRKIGRLCATDNGT